MKNAKDVEHLEWIYGRMNQVHGESENLDYMVKFNSIITSLKVVPECTWKRADYGMFGFSDYEYSTTCGKNYDCDKTEVGNHCPNCGGKIKQ